ncbi:hypothetical protein HF086_006582 [Spodoptera exigua]|uniref:Uncharacterized protein n=1 Tax=Spodoptera exigua TaxID=7107 RepID=A0A922SCC8_SPOEX|nr:hypothetical protein HF086_006582 [Spodoptera exigua]
MNCGNPLYSDAVVAGGAGSGPALAAAWRWALRERWPLAAAAALLLLLAALAALPLLLRRRQRPPPAPLNSCAADKLAPRGSKLSNLEAVRRERPASCADPPPLNNVDTLRSYGSAGDELEGIPPDYRRNLNIDVVDRKPWSEQMHLHTFVDNKIYNDLKGCKSRIRARSPGCVRRVGGGGGVGGAGGAAPEPHMLGGYHWDCSDWCGGGGALPGISEVAGSERPDSSSAASPASPAASPALRRRARAARAPTLTPRPTTWTRRASPTPPYKVFLFIASSYLLHTDEYCARAASDSEQLRARTLREPDAASLITMLEERNSLLGGDDDGSGSELSANLCEIEESDAETEPALAGPRHTDV